MRESRRVWSVCNSSTLPLLSHTFPLLWHVLQEKFSLLWALHGLQFLSGKHVEHGFFMGCRDICCAMKHLLLFWPRCFLWCFSLFLLPPPLFIPYFSPLSCICYHRSITSLVDGLWWVHCRASWTMLCLAHGSSWPLFRGVISAIHLLPLIPNNLKCTVLQKTLKNKM